MHAIDVSLYRKKKCNEKNEKIYYLRRLTPLYVPLEDRNVIDMKRFVS